MRGKITEDYILRERIGVTLVVAGIVARFIGFCAVYVIGVAVLLLLTFGVIEMLM